MVAYTTPSSIQLPERVEFPVSWAGHIPFAFWIVENLRPKKIVELGTHSGNSFCAFSQAVDRLELDTALHAVDHWAGDEHAGAYDTAVYDDLKRYMKNRYRDRPHLHRTSFDDATREFDDGSIDLLHIDGLHTYDAVKHDFEIWRQKLTANAVVLFHDTAVTNRDFGVGRYFEELAKEHLAFNFSHSHGLGVLALSENLPEPVLALLRGQADMNGLLPRSVFSRLGNAITDHFYAEAFCKVEERDPFHMGPDAPSLSEMLRMLQHNAGERITLYTGFNSPKVNTSDVSDDLPLKILASGFFSPDHYAKLAGLSTDDALALCRHYLDEGEEAGLSPSAEFDPVFYAQEYPDVVTSGSGLLEHYLFHGRHEGRVPMSAEGVIQEITPPETTKSDVFAKEE
ncbi:class I SAM-dependent methyltransferase [Limoniibacter endophyticus]|uniref:Methyltransferase family protein n=1 Tax=Limoniibacter endophyticus TaxID=1565040 RepID=A0A8J3GGZ8_9HYPH|nr:class I SAM-dependent methyltransferase [Limoniibacter endophyticus]GHC68119.1 hypothetical protein GCM10010136_12910 [Limoniibacter endophyticus]